jgi:hypothetical protein
MSDGAGDLFNLPKFGEKYPDLIKRIKNEGADLFCNALLDHIEGLKNPETGALLHSDNLTLTVLMNQSVEDAI